jgi:hypothetical protein
MLTSATFQGGQDAAPDCGCKTPPSRLVLPPWFPTWPLTQRASWSGVRLEPSAAGYELAGHIRPEQRGTALDWLSNVAIEIIGLSRRRTGRPSRRRRPRAGSACRQRTRDLRRPASTSWRTSFSECEGRSRTEAASPRPSGPSLTGPHTRNSLHPRGRRPGASRRPADGPVAALHSKDDANFALDNQPPIRARQESRITNPRGTPVPILRAWRNASSWLAQRHSAHCTTFTA